MLHKELKKILLAEDDPDLKIIIELALKTLGNYELKICSSGKEALEALNEFDPDLILTDVMMPCVDGPTLLKTVKNDPKYANLPVIFMTAKVQYHEVEEYLKMGALKVIVKPFSPVTLSSEIKQAWDDFQEGIINNS